MINAGGSFFEERSDDHHLLLARNFAQRFGRWSGNRFGEFEELDVFGLTEVLRAKELLQANDLRAAFGGLTDARDCFLEIRLGLLLATHLHQTNGCDLACSLFLRHVAKYSKGLFHRLHRYLRNLWIASLWTLEFGLGKMSGHF